MNYEPHPLCTLFPRMADAEFNALVQDIATNGLRQPIVLHEGMILDGGNRYRACIAAEVEPDFIEHDGGNLVSFVLSANMHRRHMTPGQQAAIVASAQDWAKAQGNGKPGNLARLDTRADRAALSGASDGTQKMADKVAKADPELAKQVAHGEISLPKAVEKITGKRPGAKPAEVEDYSQAERERDEIRETIDTLRTENDRLTNLAAAKVFDGSEEDRADLLNRLNALTEENARLRIELDAVKASRDAYMRENAQMKRQLKTQRKQLGMAA